MITIVEPKKHIADLWGQQRVKQEATFRQMRYVLRVDHEGKVLLHNVVTGQLVVLSPEEAEATQALSSPYAPVMEELIKAHYLVPEDYDEHQQVVNLRYILWKMVDAHPPKEVTSYLILPTTACNARCWYCFEKGVEPATMTEETADAVVKFIEKHCGGKPIYIWWFGGEPTLAADRIDQICMGLRNRHFDYFSDMTTNGYLFDKDMVDKAKNLWNLRQASFSLDGTEKTYNKVKVFPGNQDNPYQRMMRNAGLLLEKGIAVALRMNFDQDNWMEFADLLQEVKQRFPDGLPLMVYPHQINWDYPKEEQEAIEAWFNEKYVQLIDLACQYGLYRREKQELPSLIYKMCGAANNNWFVITPQGKLVCCGEQLFDNQVKGDLKNGVTNDELVCQWKTFADYEKCRNCLLFPYCASVINCNSKDSCYRKTEELTVLKGLIHKIAQSKKDN